MVARPEWRRPPAGIKTELAEKFLGAKVSTKKSGEVAGTAKGSKCKVAAGGELKWEIGGTSFTSGFDINIVKWDPGGKPKFGVITRTASIKPFSTTHVSTWARPSRSR